MNIQSAGYDMTDVVLCIISVLLMLPLLVFIPVRMARDARLRRQAPLIFRLPAQLREEYVNRREWEQERTMTVLAGMASQGACIAVIATYLDSAVMVRISLAAMAILLVVTAIGLRGVYKRECPYLPMIEHIRYQGS